MNRLVEWIRTVRGRAYLYRVLVAIGAIAGIYGLANGQELAAWLGLAATLLGTGTAAANTSTRRSRR